MVFGSVIIESELRTCKIFVHDQIVNNKDNIKHGVVNLNSRTKNEFSHIVEKEY